VLDHSLARFDAAPVVGPHLLDPSRRSRSANTAQDHGTMYAARSSATPSSPSSFAHAASSCCRGHAGQGSSWSASGVSSACPASTYFASAGDAAAGSPSYSMASLAGSNMTHPQRRHFSHSRPGSCRCSLMILMRTLFSDRLRTAFCCPARRLAAGNRLSNCRCSRSAPAGTSRRRRNLSRSSGLDVGMRSECRMSAS